MPTAKPNTRPPAKPLLLIVEFRTVVLLCAGSFVVGFLVCLLA